MPGRHYFHLAVARNISYAPNLIWEPCDRFVTIAFIAMCENISGSTYKYPFKFCAKSLGGSGDFKGERVVG